MGTVDLAAGRTTELLRAWRNGDRSALDRLIPIVYKELHRLAHHYLRSERAGHSLQTSALVNEAYMRLVDYTRMEWKDRAHFLAVSAQLMRRILVEYARRRNLKRGREAHQVSLEQATIVSASRAREMIALDDALKDLARIDPRKVQIVELRFFGGLSVEETAEALSISSPTVLRDWSSAKAWLYREITSGNGES